MWLRLDCLFDWRPNFGHGLGPAGTKRREPWERVSRALTPDPRNEADEMLLGPDLILIMTDALEPVPDLVKLSKLDTLFHPEYTQHSIYVPGVNPSWRKVRIEERWKRKRRIGQGGCGEVCLQECIQGKNQRNLRAVKQIPKHGSSNYHKELEAIALFSHPKYEQNFVKSFGWYENEEDVFLTMEYFPCGDLHAYLGSPLPETECQLLITQILEGLYFMHDHHFAHRDLKPKNILVANEGPDWWVKIADFGISKRAIEGGTNLHTRTGTQGFMAPEVFSNDATSKQTHYTNAVDIWSLSVIAFLLLSGQNPFDDWRNLEQLVRGKFVFPMEILRSKQASEQGCDFIRTLMQPKPDDRPGVEDCRRHTWLQRFYEVLGSTSEFSSPDLLSSVEDPSDGQPSARWSTREQTRASASTILRPILQNPFLTPASASWSIQHPDDEIPTSGTHMPISELDEIMKPKLRRLTITQSETTTHKNWAVLRQLQGLSRLVDVITYSPDGKQLALGSADKTIELCDLDTWKLSKTLKGHTDIVHTVVYSPNGTQLASGSVDKTVKVWDLNTGKVIRTLKGHTDVVHMVAYSPNGTQLASGSIDKTVKVWDLNTGKVSRTLRDHSNSVLTVCYSPNGTQLASGSADNTIKVWDLNTGKVLKTLRDHSSTVWTVCYSPNGLQLASGSSDKTIKVWELNTGIILRTSEGHTQRVLMVACSPNGKQLASGSDDGTIKLWNPDTGALMNTLRGDHAGVWDVVYSPDGEQIASLSKGGEITLWGPSMESNLPVGQNDPARPLRSRESRPVLRKRDLIGVLGRLLVGS